MPAESSKQAHTAQMAAAVKGGHVKLKDLPPGARSAVKSMMSMSREQLGDFFKVKKKS